MVSGAGVRQVACYVGVGCRVCVSQRPPRFCVGRADSLACSLAHALIHTVQTPPPTHVVDACGRACVHVCGVYVCTYAQSNDVPATRQTLLSWFYDDCLRKWFAEGDVAGVQLTFTLTKIAIWLAVCYGLYRANYFWKI
jgi:hypothetical protein